MRCPDLEIGARRCLFWLRMFSGAGLSPGGSCVASYGRLAKVGALEAGDNAASRLRIVERH